MEADRLSRPRWRHWQVEDWTQGEFWFLDRRFGLVANPEPPPDSIPRFQPQYDVSAEIYRTRPSSATFVNLHQYDIVVEMVRPQAR